jgi:hypothetical protein
MEMDQAYCDVICERYLKFTGQAPIRERDGAAWCREGAVASELAEAATCA